MNKERRCDIEIERESIYIGIYILHYYGIVHIIKILSFSQNGRILKFATQMNQKEYSRYTAGSLRSHNQIKA